MLRLTPHNAETLRLEHLGKQLHARFPEIIALFLFGSKAIGNACETSDIDLAILTTPDAPLTSHQLLASSASVTAFLQTDQVDLVWLNRAKLLLQWEVVRTGQLLLCTDAVAVAEYIEWIERAARDVSYYSQLCQAWYRTFLAQVYLQKGKEPMLDVRRITDKIDYIRNTSRPALEQLAALDADRFAADSIALGAAKYYVQSAIEAMLDIATHIMARKGLGTFETHAKTFETLAAHGIVRQEHLDTYRQMIGLRNRLVHVYEDIDPITLHQIIGQELADFDRFIEDVTALLVAEEDQRKDG